MTAKSHHDKEDKYYNAVHKLNKKEENKYLLNPIHFLFYNKVPILIYICKVLLHNDDNNGDIQKVGNQVHRNNYIYRSLQNIEDTGGGDHDNDAGGKPIKTNYTNKFLLQAEGLSSNPGGDGNQKIETNRSLIRTSNGSICKYKNKLIKLIKAQEISKEVSRVILEYLITSVKRYKLSLSPVRALNRDKLRAIFKSTTMMLPVRLYVISRLSSANKIQGCQIMDKIGKFRAIQPALGFFISMRFVTFPSNFRYLSPP